MTTEYTDAPRTRVMTPASLNNGVHENHSIGQTVAITPKKRLFDDLSIPQIIAGAAAAATSAALASKIGVVGSVIGAAVSSVVTVVSSQVYRHFISAGAEAIKSSRTDTDYPAEAYRPVEGSAAEDPANAQPLPRATTARVAPESLRAKAAAERSKTQKQVIIFSIVIAVVAVALSAGAILVTTAGEGLGERPEPMLSAPQKESDQGDDSVQVPSQATGVDSTGQANSSSSQSASADTSSSSGTASTNNSSTDSSQSTTTDSSSSSSGQADSSSQGGGDQSGTDGSSSSSSNGDSSGQADSSASALTGTSN